MFHITLLFLLISILTLLTTSYASYKNTIKIKPQSANFQTPETLPINASVWVCCFFESKTDVLARFESKNANRNHGLEYGIKNPLLISLSILPEGFLREVTYAIILFFAFACEFRLNKEIHQTKAQKSKPQYSKYQFYLNSTHSPTVRG